jgi:hypothetical protein
VERKFAAFAAGWRARNYSSLYEDLPRKAGIPRQALCDRGLSESEARPRHGGYDIALLTGFCDAKRSSAFVNDNAWRTTKGSMARITVLRREQRD